MKTTWKNVTIAAVITGVGWAVMHAPIAPAWAGGDESKRSPSLTDAGMSFDAARRLAPAEMASELERLDGAVKKLLDGELDDREKGAAYLLSAEIRYALGRYEEAVEAYGEAYEQHKESQYADEISAARIRALESAGQDQQAAQLWSQWLVEYPKSTFTPEVKIAQMWNALRRDSLSEASGSLVELQSQYPWVSDDPRVQLAEATIALREGRHGDIALEPSGSSLDPAMIYLNALADAALGKPLKAAAKFQKVADRYPDSRLRDPALLAKANIFLVSGSYRSAAEEFARTAELARDESIRAEAHLRAAASLYLDGDAAAGATALQDVAAKYDGTDVAARAQMLVGEVLLGSERYDEAIVAFNNVLTKYFQHSLAAGAQYRVGRCLDLLGRGAEATGSYQAVVSGYPTSREAPAAAYLAGVGLLSQKRPRAAVPYFQLVLDRYAQDKGEGTIEFATPERQELVEASLCLLQWSYHQAGDLGMLSGVPHLLLMRMPPSESLWRANALLIDADAMAAAGRYDEAQAALERMIDEFPNSELAVPANRLLAWTYAQRGDIDLAMKTEEKMLKKYGKTADRAQLSDAYLNRANILFNKKDYKAAAKAYENFIQTYPDHAHLSHAYYQAGVCYMRLGLDGDAVDKWETMIGMDPSAKSAEEAWVRAGDVYFRAGHYEEAARCYQGLLEHFPNSRKAPVAQLRMAQCRYNANEDQEAIAAYSTVIDKYPSHPAADEAQKGIEQSLYRLGKNEGGEAMLEELVSRFPTSPFAADAQFELGLRHYEAEAYTEAADAFRRVVTQFPDYSAADRAHFLMADSYSRAGDEEQARMANEQFLKFFPDSEYRITIVLRRGAARFAEGDYTQAETDFREVLSNTNDNKVKAAGLFNLALCRRMLGDDKDATKLLERYRKSYPNDERKADVANQLGDIYEKAERFDHAIMEFRRALSSNPGDDLKIELFYRAGMCREKMGNDKAALANFSEAKQARDPANPFRLAAVARMAALYEKTEQFKKALSAYRDLMQNAQDPEIVKAASTRVAELEAIATP